MNPHDEQLADYLGGTLSPEDRHAFEEELARNPALQAELEALQQTESALRDDLVSLEEAEREVAGLQPPIPNQTGWIRTGQVVALLLLGFALGFWSRGPGAPLEVSTEPAPAMEAPVDSSFARLATRYQSVSAERPKMSRFGRGLLALRSGR